VEPEGATAVEPQASADEPAGREAPLAGVRVLDLTRFIAGPYCTMLLADQGAEVVKVEPPEGEDTRRLAPAIGPGDGVSAYFLRYNRSKKSIAIDLRSEAGREIFAELVRHADVLVENFRPGVLDRLGFGWEQLEKLNPRLVYATITGYGYEDSPNREHGAFTPIVEAAAGALIYRAAGGDPTISGYPVGDIFPASLTVASIAAALYRRERDGRGARVDIAMYDAMVSLNERAVGMSAMVGRDHFPGVATDMGSAPTGVYEATDGYITLAVVGEPIWQRFCAVLDRPDWAVDPELLSGTKRSAAHESVIRPGIQAWLSTRTREQAVAELTAAGVPAASAARPLEVVAAQQTRARGMVVEYETYEGGTATVAGNPMRFAGEQRDAPGAAPAVGEHTRAVLAEWAGFDDARIDDLAAGGAVVSWEAR
jgi:CoA:oxalate CoA-transferase